MSVHVLDVIHRTAQSCIILVEYRDKLYAVKKKCHEEEVYNMRLCGKSAHVVRLATSDPGHNDIWMPFYQGGSLHDVLLEKGALDAKYARRWTKQLLKGILHIHQRGLVHGCITPKKLMLKEGLDRAWCNKTLVIVDLRFAVAYDTDSECIDIWGAGLVLLSMLTGSSSTRWDQIHPWAKDLVSRMLELDEKKRITVTHALRHPWLKQTAPPDLLRRAILNASLPWL